MSALSPLPNLSRRANATFARYDAENDFEAREREMANRERRIRDREKQLQAQADEIAARETAQREAESRALQEHVDRRLTEGRTALGLDHDRSSSRPFDNTIEAAHDGRTAREILRAGAARKNSGAPPLPVDGVARAIVLCGQLRRAEITAEQYAALLDGRAK